MCGWGIAREREREREREEESRHMERQEKARDANIIYQIQKN